MSSGVIIGPWKLKTKLAGSIRQSCFDKLSTGQGEKTPPYFTVLVAIKSAPVKMKNLTQAVRFLQRGH